jgi:hypothetical protein
LGNKNREEERRRVVRIAFFMDLSFTLILPLSEIDATKQKAPPRSSSQSKRSF